MSKSLLTIRRANTFTFAGLTFLILLTLSWGSHASAAPPMPSIEDEKRTYDRWGWDWSGAIQPTTISEPYRGTYFISNPDIHGDTEADDLWTYIQMVKRGGNSVYSTRASAWLRYFKEDYRACAGDSYSNFCYDKNAFGGCHFYGYGLLAQYEYNGDTSALTEAIALGNVLEALYDPQQTSYGCLPANACTHYGYRRPGRHLILAARLYEVTGDTRWANLRDKIVDLVLNSSDWHKTYGMYFWGQWETDQKIGTGAYAAGYRGYWPTGIAILAEAFWQVWRTTGSPAVKDRLVSMATFVDKFGLDPVVQYAGYTAGVDPNGKPYHSGLADSSYTTSLVNILVMGYKLTGNSALLSRAKTFFNRGTKGVYGSTTIRLCADDKVHHFVDTIFASSTNYVYLDRNRAELLYTYLIFENGGNPIIEGAAPSPPRNLRIE
jgi:hypothetical protein